MNQTFKSTLTGSTNKIVDHVCTNEKCDYTVADFEDEKLICPRCESKMKISTMMNPKVKGVKTFFHADPRKG